GVARASVAAQRGGKGSVGPSQASARTRGSCLNHFFSGLYVGSLNTGQPAPSALAHCPHFSFSGGRMKYSWLVAAAVAAVSLGARSAQAATLLYGMETPSGASSA